MLLLVTSCASQPGDRHRRRRARHRRRATAWTTRTRGHRRRRCTRRLHVRGALPRARDPSKNILGTRGQLADWCRARRRVDWEDSAHGRARRLRPGRQRRADRAPSRRSRPEMPATRPILLQRSTSTRSRRNKAPIDAYSMASRRCSAADRTGAYGGVRPDPAPVRRRQHRVGVGKRTRGRPAQWDPRAQLRQIQNGIAGGSEDLDEAVAIDFGQWGHQIASRRR